MTRYRVSAINILPANHTEVDATSATAALAQVTTWPVTYKWPGVAHATNPAQVGMDSREVEFYRAEPLAWRDKGYKPAK